MAVFYNRATLVYNGQSTSSNQVSGEVTSTLSLTKTALNQSYGEGGGIAYAVSITNSGSTQINDISFSDDLGAYSVGETTVVPLTYRDGSLLYYLDGALQPTPEITAGTELTVSGINIPAGSGAVIIYEVIANAYAPLSAGSEITNTITGGGACSELSASAAVPVREEAELSIAKTISPEEITDCLVTYAFIIQNSGNLAAGEGLTVEDIFDPILQNIDVTLDGAELAEGTGYTYDVTTGEFATVSGAITVDAATYTQDAETGLITTAPGVSILKVSGSLS